MGLMLGAAAWGFAEALLFFFVPDVLLTGIALKDRRSALYACLAAAGGATIGGALMCLWGSASLPAVLSILERVPGISPEMIARVRAELLTDGIWAMVLGPLSGTPYKIYAAQAASTGLPLWLFVIVTPFARLPRFLITTLLASLAARLLRTWNLSRLAYPLWFIAWAGFYTIYLVCMN